jgi:hypothetical protein
MPSHWGILDNPWSPERFTRWAAGIGPSTREIVERVLSSKVIVEQGFVPCQNILGLAKTYGKKNLEEACAKVCAESCAAPSYTIIKNVIVMKKQQDDDLFPVKIDGPATDRMKGKGRVRGAGHYRIKGGGE